MKFVYKLFVVVFATVFWLNGTDAKTSSASTPRKCPPGCFCLNDGKYTAVSGTLEQKCSKPAKNISKSSTYSYLNSQCGLGISTNSFTAKDDMGSLDDYAMTTFYYINDFSELYHGELGFYGFKQDGFVYVNECYSSNKYYDDIFNCPETHPHSDAGSNALVDCYKYDENGNKVFYGPSNQSSALNKWANANDDSSLIGVNVDTSNFDLSNSNLSNNGWVAGVVCKPGTYMPANTPKCTTCPTGNTCPGGFFYTDKTYTVDRGITQTKTDTSTTTTNNKNKKPSTPQEQIGIRKAGKLQIHR